jgi:uroporphyrinogen decarboxylase
MTKRQVVIEALGFRPPPYVPWAWGPTQQCADRLREHLGTDGLDRFIDTHFLDVGESVGRFQTVDENHVRDVYGVVWDRTVDKDIGTPCDWPIKKPADLARYTWPDCDNPAWYAGLPQLLAAKPGLFRRYCIGFSLFERAWTMRGMEDLLADMVERPEFVEELLDAIVEHDLRQVRHGLELDVDAVYFGDDYGMQTGLIMGARHWRRFFKPRLARMFEPVRRAGKYVSMHSCGCVVEIFDDLVEIGLNLFNPFQPEVMDVFAIRKRYHDRLAFHGGMSIQRVLPFGSVGEVRRETQRLIDLGRDGGYVFSPSHAVPRDVPPENLVAMVEVLKSQPGYPGP